ncbi:MAG: hypothetical protein IIA67_09045 [Planctomycetes bacterium]|nr:hypothetical protein [Planctomycetota bacterium]
MRLSQGVRRAAATAPIETPRLITAPFAVLRPQVKDDSSRPSTIVLGRPQAQIAAPLAALRIKSNGAAASGASANGSSIRLTVPQRQPTRRVMSLTRGVWGN